VERIPVQEARRNFADIVRLVTKTRQRFLIQEYKTDRVGMVPLEDLALLEGLANGDKTTTRLTTADVEQHLNEDIEFFSNSTGWFVVHEDGKDLAALVPHRDVQMLEGLDDSIDLAAAKRLLDEELDQQQ
jgi:hypothetical protein